MLGPPWPEDQDLLFLDQSSSLRLGADLHLGCSAAVNLQLDSPIDTVRQLPACRETGEAASDRLQVNVSLFLSSDLLV